MQSQFVEFMMMKNEEWRMVPRAQVERNVQLLLSMFIEKVFTSLLKHKENSSGEIKLISEEFPLKKEEDGRASSIDWLLFNPTLKQLIFVELKTSNSLGKNDDKQNKRYLARKKLISKASGSKLINDLKNLKGEKYRYVETEKVSPFVDEIKNCYEVIIVYLVPKTLRGQIKNKYYSDLILTFEDLPKEIKGPFKEEWSIVQNYLRKLDYPPKGLEKFASKSKGKEIRDNFEERVDFERIMELCKEKGDSIVVGFNGGKRKMYQDSIVYLVNRRKYKWDFATYGKGVKTPKNWFYGSIFLEMITERIDSSTE